MCGIGGTTEGETDAKRISARIKRRGPDMQGLRATPSISLCHRRLSIIDLSARGKQPLRHKHLTITYNGEIYNYRELAASHFPGEKLEKGCDTEVLIRLYAKYGEACLPLLRGMWAFAIYDEKKQELFLATDRFGKKPVYYEYQAPGNIVKSSRTAKSNRGTPGHPVFRFASEARALLRGTETINQQALDTYLELGVIAAPHSIWNEIRKLEPARWMRFSLKTGARTDGIHWTPYTTNFTRSYESAVEELRGLLDASVRYRMIADVPVGCFLSGGVDSSVISAIAHAQRAAHGEKLHTFSIGFADLKYDESKYSKPVADAIGTTHHHREASVKELAQVFTKLPQIYSEPFADSSALPTYLVSKLAREHVTVSLSGDGADELFGGYRTYNHARRLQIINKSPLRPLLPKHLRGVAAQSYAGLLGASRSSLTFNGALHAQASGDWVQKLARADIAHYLPADILTKVDRASMAHALEVRCPFLDHDVARFGLSLPAKFKITQPVPLLKFVNKRILKDAYRTELPSVIFDRPKQGFSIPEPELLTELGARTIDWEALGRPKAPTQAKTYREYVLADWAQAHRKNTIIEEI